MARSGIRNKLGRHTRLFIVVTGLFLVAAPVRVLAQPTTYAAGCKVQIQAIGPGGVGHDPKNSPTESVGSFETIIEWIHSPAMAARVANDLKVPVERVLGHINASLVTGTQVIALTAVDSDAAFAARLCNGFAIGFLQARLDTAKSMMNTALEAQKARVTSFRSDLAALDRKIGAAGRVAADEYRFQRLQVVTRISNVSEEIANLEAARGLGIQGAGQIIQPAGSTGAPVGPNRAFPIGLMALGTLALAATALTPRRHVTTIESPKTY